MKTLALDLGTTTGWAYQSGGDLTSGTWRLDGGRFDTFAMRFLRFKRYLNEVLESGIDVIYFEEVRQHNSRNPKTGRQRANFDAAHVYGGMVTTLTAWCEVYKIPAAGVPIAHIKKQATGKGNANKDMIVTAAQARWPRQNVIDNNQADALWILECARKRIY